MRTQLKLRHILVLIYWAMFKRHKALLMKYWEDKGMVDLYAYRLAKKSTKKDWEAIKAKL